MLEGLVRTPRGRIPTRKLVTLFATVVVACFAHIILFAPSTYAADANWNGDSLSYDAKDYTGPKTAVANDRSGLPQGTVYYATYENADPRTGREAKGYLIYFDSGADPTKATKGQYVTADYDVASGRFSNLSPPKEIDIDASSYGDEETIGASSCDVSGIGWVICPVSSWVAEGMDYLYGVIASYLNVAPIVGGDSGLYEMWDVVRSIANICFIIGFLILIYAQITGAVISSYTIKKMLPRVIIAAILVNVSYWICAIAVDVSNILGAAVQDMFMAMQERIGAANSAADDIGWVKVTALALGGGSLATIGLLGATAGGAGALAFAIIAALVPAIFAVFVAVVILAARQALITVLIVLSPLAFVAYLLPNTEEWFGRWRKLFTALMVMFPAFAVLFGGAQLTGVLIIQNATSLPVVILGLLVQVIPLFITPFLIKLSSGLMSTIAGLANDRSKGVFDRAKNWAGENRDMHKARAMRNGLDQNRRFRRGRPTTLGARIAGGKMHRDKMTAAYNAQAEGRYGNTRRGQRSYTEGKVGELDKAYSAAHNEEMWQSRVAGEAVSTRRTQLGRNREDQRYHNYQEAVHHTHSAEGRANILKESIHDAGERHFRESIADAAPGTYEARLQGRQIQSAVDKGVAENAKKFVDAQGTLALKQTVRESDHLRNQVAQTVQFEKTAEQYETIVQKAAEAAYVDFSRTNVAEQNLRLQAVEQSDRAALADKEWESVVEEAKAKGYNSPSIDAANSVVADNLQYIHRQLSAEEKRIENAKFAQRRNIVTAFKDDQVLREYAGGVEGTAGATRIQAQFTKEFIDESVQAVMTNRSLTSQLTRNQLKKMLYEGKDENDEEVTTEMQQAAMYELLQEKGNNMDAQEIRDAITKKGFKYDEVRNKFYEFKRDGSGRVERDAEGQPQADYSREVSAEKAGDRRDWQQFFEDAAKGSPHNIGTLSGTNRSESKAGNLVDDTRYAFIRDAAFTGKFGPEKLVKADIDELKIMAEDMQDRNGEYWRLSADERARFDASFENAVIGVQTHPSYKGQIDDRNRGVMNDILARINPAYRTGRVDAAGNPVFDVRDDNAIVTAGSTQATRQFTAPIRVEADFNDPQYERLFRPSTDPATDIVDL